MFKVLMMKVLHSAIQYPSIYDVNPSTSSPSLTIDKAHSSSCGIAAIFIAELSRH